MELKAHQFFSFFNSTVADELQRAATIKTFPARAILFEEGEPSDCLYLVLSGQVELCKRAEHGSYLTIAYAGANDFFGELGVLDGSVRSTRGVAVEETLLAAVPREPILAVLRSVPGQTAIDVFTRTIQHLRLTDERYVAEVVRKEKMALIGEMAGAIIHDLRNPCHGVLMSSSVIGRLHEDETTQRCCKIIQNQVHLMHAMVEDLLDYSRGTHKLSKESISLDELLQRFVFLHQDYLRQRQVELDIQPAEAAVDVDVTKLLRVLQNLVYNAAEAFEDARGRITISCRGLDGWVELCVRDNGPGIPEEIKDRVFSPFVTAGKKSGTGLGLAIAKSIVEAHAGQISCESKRGEGAAFLVRLPRVRCSGV